MAKIKFPTLAQFRKFLEDGNPNGIAGHRGHPRSCPIAKYFKSAGVHNPFINFGMYEVEQRVGTNPKWAIKFIEIIDALEVVRITYKRALLALNEVTGVATHG